LRQNDRFSVSRAWLWTSFAGLILFLFLQVYPLSGGIDAGRGSSLSRDEVREEALQLAKSRFNIGAEPGDVTVTHLSDSTTVGYLSKEERLKEYEKQWSADYPTDVYRTDIRDPAGGVLTLLLHMKTGKLVGWQDGQAAPKAKAEPAIPASPESSASAQQAAKRALSYASFWGVRPADWEWDGHVPLEQERMVFHSRKSGLGEARLVLEVSAPPEYSLLSSAFPPWRSGSVTYHVKVPGAFKAYLEEQTGLAGKLNAFGFVVPHLFLLIMAMVYAGARKQHTSLRRGAALAVVFALLYSIFYLNMIPGFRAGLLQDGLPGNRTAVNASLVVNFAVLAIMALFTWLSAVAGDGLWRAAGKPLWPKWREPGFGLAVMSGMKMGYVLAFLLLGAQSLLLIGLHSGIGMFQASDASQSSYNMIVPWLLPLLAWCAGISEELQSRLFGIGLFRDWLLRGAERVLGRKLSPRGETAVTFLAALPPGLFWACGHVSYAVYPAYSRIIELVLMSLLFAWIMMRFGLLTVIFSHVILNSVLMSVQLAFDRLPGNGWAAFASLVLPAAVAVAIGRIHRKWPSTPPVRQG
jgi:hypothetical protein